MFARIPLNVFSLFTDLLHLFKSEEEFFACSVPFFLWTMVQKGMMKQDKNTHQVNWGSRGNLLSLTSKRLFLILDICSPTNPQRFYTGLWVFKTKFQFFNVERERERERGRKEGRVGERHKNTNSCNTTRLFVKNYLWQFHFSLIITNPTRSCGVIGRVSEQRVHLEQRAVR